MQAPTRRRRIIVASDSEEDHAPNLQQQELSNAHTAAAPANADDAAPLAVAAAAQAAALAPFMYAAKYGHFPRERPAQLKFPELQPEGTQQEDGFLWNARPPFTSQYLATEAAYGDTSSSGSTGTSDGSLSDDFVEKGTSRFTCDEALELQLYFPLTAKRFISAAQCRLKTQAIVIAAPSVQAIDTAAPSMQANDTAASSVLANVTAAPSMPANDTAAPSVQANVTAAPSVQAILTAAPSVHANVTAAPSTPANDTAAPSVHANVTAAPNMLQPEGTHEEDGCLWNARPPFVIYLLPMSGN